MRSIRGSSPSGPDQLPQRFLHPLREHSLLHGRLRDRYVATHGGSSFDLVRVAHHAPTRSGRAGGTAVTSKFYEPRDNLSTTAGCCSTSRRSSGTPPTHGRCRRSSEAREIGGYAGYRSPRRSGCSSVLPPAREKNTASSAYVLFVVGNACRRLWRRAAGRDRFGAAGGGDGARSPCHGRAGCQARCSSCARTMRWPTSSTRKERRDACRPAGRTADFPARGSV